MYNTVFQYSECLKIDDEAEADLTKYDEMIWPLS